MTTDEEILVSGEDFIERRIFIYPQQGDMVELEHRAYARGYDRGWLNGFSIGAALLVFAAFCVWFFS
jgi:hypothetical protein